MRSSVFDLLLALMATLTMTPISGLSAETLTASDEDYYLYQAYRDSTGSNMLPLNHIGIRTIPSATGYLVTAVLNDYPAQAAGILRGDIITAANGEPFHPVYTFNTESAAPDDYVASAENHTLNITRGEQQLTVEVAPVFESIYDSMRSATANSVQEFPNGNKIIGYVRFWSLSRNSNDLITLHKLIADLSHCDGIIIDLRDAYGYLDVAHLQLVYRGSADLLTVSDDSRDRLLQQGYPLEPATNYRQPVALMINEQTRGGAELLAYQLDKLSRVITVGSRTAGKIGRYSNADATANVETGAEELRYLPATETLVDGIRFEDQGLQPEQQVPYPYTRPGRVDPQFQSAVDVLMGVI